MVSSFTLNPPAQGKLIIIVIVIFFLISKDLFGILKLTALSSGYCLGSCNWVIESDYEKVRMKVYC